MHAVAAKARQRWRFTNCRMLAALDGRDRRVHGEAAGWVTRGKGGGRGGRAMLIMAFAQMCV